MKTRTDLHLARKFWHMGGVLAMYGVYTYMGLRFSWILLLTLGGSLILMDILRQKRPALNRAALRVFGPVMRAHESNAPSGLSYMVVGCAILLWFPPPIIQLTLLFLAIGDPIASFFGVSFGKDKILNNKTLQGSLAAFVVCTGIAAIYYYTQNIMTERLLIVAPFSGLIAAVAELWPVGKLDDNLTFPVLSAILLSVLFYIFGGFHY